MLINIVILLLLAAVVAFLPGGEGLARTVVALIGMAFLTGIGWFGFRIWRDQQYAIESLGDGRRAILYSAVGLIALLIAGYGQFGGWTGFLLWFGLLALAGFVIFRIGRDATRLS